MTEHQELKYFITESLFLVNEPAGLEEPKKAEEVPSPSEQATVSNEVAEPPAVAIPKIKQPQPPATDQEIHELMVLVFPMNSQDEELLNNLLKAIKKTRADIKLVNSFSDFGTNFKKLIAFGYLNELKARLEPGIIEFVNTNWEGRNILVSVPLSSLHNNNADKAKLWKALQEKFL